MTAATYEFLVEVETIDIQFSNKQCDKAAETGTRIS
jgi:hypothetical protein